MEKRMKKILVASIVGMVCMGLVACDAEPAHEHTYTPTVVAATCESSGYTLYACECGESYKGEETAALAHEYGKWTTVLEPTYETEDRREKKCQRCDAGLFESIPKLIPHEHNCAEEITQPTCTEKGASRQICQDCGAVVSEEELAAVGHGWSSWETTKAATTTETGSKTRTCKTCGETETASIPKTNSTSVKPSIPEQPEASTDEPSVSQPSQGTTGHVHTFGYYQVNEFRAPTENKLGEIYRFCDCGYRDSRWIPSYDYNVTDPITGEHICARYGKTILATCVHPQYSVTLCTGCDYRSEYHGGSQALADHAYSQWTVIKEATATATGERTRTCSVCKKVNNEVIPATGEERETYIDPRITIKTYAGNGHRSYTYTHVGVVDVRTWGDPPSIRITSSGGLAVVYYKQDGTKVTCSINPVDEYFHDIVLLEDGTYNTRLIGDFKD